MSGDKESIWVIISSLATLAIALKAIDIRWGQKIKGSWISFWLIRFKHTKRIRLKLVRDKDDTEKVYAIIKKEKRWITTQTTLNALGYTGSDVRAITSEKIQEYTEGDSIKIIPRIK